MQTDKGRIKRALIGQSYSYQKNDTVSLERLLKWHGLSIQGRGVK